MIKSNFMPCGSVGPKGDDGITPHIGSNGNWFLGEKDTNTTATGPRGPRGFRGEQGLKGDSGDNVKLCDTIFNSHTTEQIDTFATHDYRESFDITQILDIEDLKIGDTVGLFIDNSDTGNQSIYFGVVQEKNLNSLVCLGRGAIHSGVKTTVSSLKPSVEGFSKFNVTVTKRKDIVYCNIDVNITTQPNDMTKLFDVPVGYRPLTTTSVYCIISGAICRLAIDPNGSVQLAKVVIGNMETSKDSSVSFNYKLD